jgi:hypothetical protein
MSFRRILAISVIALVWSVALICWYIGLGYEANGFRLPDPARDRVGDILIFYVPLLAMAWLVSKPLRRTRNAANH